MAGQSVYGAGVPIDWIPISAGVTAYDPAFRAIRANTAGTLTVTTLAGNSRVMNFAAGETRLVAGTAITAASSATGIEIAI